MWHSRVWVRIWLGDVSLPRCCVSDAFECIKTWSTDFSRSYLFPIDICMFMIFFTIECTILRFLAIIKIWTVSLSVWLFWRKVQTVTVYVYLTIVAVATCNFECSCIGCRLVLSTVPGSNCGLTILLVWHLFGVQFYWLAYFGGGTFLRAWNEKNISRPITNAVTASMSITFTIRLRSLRV